MRMFRSNHWVKVVSCWVVACFSLFSAVSPIGAQIQYYSIPNPGEMVNLSEAYKPPVMMGITINEKDPFKFDFIFDTGDAILTNAEQKEEFLRLIKYFLASMAIPDTDLWVNLSPYEKEQTIPDVLAKTEMGRDLLAQDYMLKQLSASLLYPMSDLGKTFWDKVYKEAYAKFGTTKIPVNTFNKIWIVPQNAEIYESGNSAYLLNVRLKVMLDQDYVSLEKNGNNSKLGTDKLSSKDVKDVNSVSSKVMQEVILPAVEKEVNEGKNFALLRQMVNSMIMAAWFKMVLKESFLGQMYADKGKVAGVDQRDTAANEQIYNQYFAAFQKGVFNLVKDDVDPGTKKAVPRKYFSGGFALLAIKPLSLDQMDGLNRQLAPLGFTLAAPSVQGAIPITSLPAVSGSPMITRNLDANPAKITSALRSAGFEINEPSRLSSPSFSVPAFNRALSGVPLSTNIQISEVPTEVVVQKALGQRKIRVARTSLAPAVAASSTTTVNPLKTAVQTIQTSGMSTEMVGTSITRMRGMVSSLPEGSLTNVELAAVPALPVFDSIARDLGGVNFVQLPQPQKLQTLEIAQLAVGMDTRLPSLPAVQKVEISGRTIDAFTTNVQTPGAIESLGRLGDVALKSQSALANTIPTASITVPQLTSLGLQDQDIPQLDDLTRQITGLPNATFATVEPVQQRIVLGSLAALTPNMQEARRLQTMVPSVSSSIMPTLRVPAARVPAASNTLPRDEFGKLFVGFVVANRGSLEGMEAIRDEIKGVSDRLPSGAKPELLNSLSLGSRGLLGTASLVMYNKPFNDLSTDEIRGVTSKALDVASFTIDSIRTQPIDFQQNLSASLTNVPVIETRSKVDNFIVNRMPASVDGGTLNRLSTGQLESLGSIEMDTKSTLQPMLIVAANAASRSLQAAPVIPGGIDLNPINLDMQIKRDGKGVPLPISEQDFANINFDGLIPQILDIRPMSALPMASADQAGVAQV